MSPVPSEIERVSEKCRTMLFIDNKVVLSWSIINSLTRSRQNLGRKISLVVGQFACCLVDNENLGSLDM